ncbi:MAG: family 20 glycosylhydrolase [Pseudomonadales bacterium]|nr:family 20 glycosylhydrolase [Pseudomonadales bacterium]
MLKTLPRLHKVELDALGRIPAGPLSLQWVSDANAPIEARAAACLNAYETGVIEIDIASPVGDVPMFAVDESYRIDKTEAGWRVSAETQYGGLHAITTLGQLYRLGGFDEVESIEDQPRYPWRGVLIDVARHFLSVVLLRRVIDGLAELKINVLHLHLTDDQAFRFECVHFPRLASVEHYSQDQLRELVVYAAARGIRVVPELDVPGHVTSWLTKYPEWGFQQVNTTDRFGVHKACLDPTSAIVYDAVIQIFSELADIFPDEYVHIGGDEVHPAWWSEDQSVKAFQAEKGLVDGRAVQNYFTTRIVDALRERSKKAIGWDEVLHPEMPNLVVQNWRGATSRDRTLDKGLGCIVSAPYYLDLFYPADMHYAFDPSRPQAEWVALEDDQQQDLRLRHVAEGLEWTKQWRDEAIATDPDVSGVIGGEACLWSELVDEQTLETRLWSRLPAVAEQLWCDPDGDVVEFYTRLSSLLSAAPFKQTEEVSRKLVGLGLTDAQVQIACYLEPVKWYGRLLGQQALEARIAGSEMPQARPYQVDTPLDRVIDFISPESLSARALRDADEATWLLFAKSVLAEDVGAWPEDVQAAITGLQEFAQLIVAGTLDTEKADAYYSPYGEFMLAPVHAWLLRG